MKLTISTLKFAFYLVKNAENIKLKSEDKMILINFDLKLFDCNQ